MVLDISMGVEDVDKENEEEEEADLEKKVVTASIGQLVDHMKQTSWLVILTVAIQNPSLTNQKLNALIVKR